MSTKYSFSDFNYCMNDGVFKYPIDFPHFYSDGSLIESKIYEILRNSKDNSIFSKELYNKIENWATEYHFSYNRHNLLRHIGLKNKTFLELGTGCGGITRYIGENAQKVVGVEGSLIRAKCASQRCKDLKNVNIYHANFNDIVPEEKFDFVSLIGVLEYASMYSNTVSPFKDCLKIASNFLKPDGSLIIAIENKLGLKYFSGLSEDHTSIPYYGLYDLYKKNTARTFGKLELVELLANCGLNHNDFFYPFPDYKLPTVILTEQSLNENINLSDILYSIIPRDYSRKSSSNFNNNLVWHSIEQNNLIDQFANSFLVIACKKQHKLNNNDLVYQYTTNRKNIYNTITKFKKVSNNIVVEKESIEWHLPQKNNFINQKIGSVKYIHGSLLEKDITKAIVAERMDDFMEYLELWLRFLFDSAIEQLNDNIFLSKIKKKYFDCIPKNIIVKKKECFYIDQEWELSSDMNLYLLLLRYFLSLEEYKIDFINKYFLNNKSYLVNLFQQLKIPIIIDEFKKFELLTNNVHCKLLDEEPNFKFNYNLLKKSREAFHRKVAKKVLRILRFLLKKLKNL